MDALLAKTSIGISELREAPARVFEQAGMCVCEDRVLRKAIAKLCLLQNKWNV